MFNSFTIEVASLMEVEDARKRGLGKFSNNRGVGNLELVKFPFESQLSSSTFMHTFAFEFRLQQADMIISRPKSLGNLRS